MIQYKNRQSGYLGQKIRQVVCGILLAGMMTGCASTENAASIPENSSQTGLEQEESSRETAEAEGTEHLEEPEGTENIKDAEDPEGTKDVEEITIKDAMDNHDAEEGEDNGTDGQTELKTMGDLFKESGLISETAQNTPETVLWFNATYATLTYSNGCNWRIVGGLEPTEDNADLTKALLLSGWNVLTREDALDTAERLLEEGHRSKCRECMDELEELGLLELSEEEFFKKILEMDLEQNPGRYIITYYMHLSGIEPEYIAAFDLCRVNELYGYYYVCGFMDYEEAMDASLQNSLALQQMYGSWEEMMDAYLLGYQFWKGDFAIDDDSPTKERYHYYEMLSGLSDGPFTIDWDMELKKSW